MRKWNFVATLNSKWTERKFTSFLTFGIETMQTFQLTAQSGTQSLHIYIDCRQGCRYRDYADILVNSSDRHAESIYIQTVDKDAGIETMQTVQLTAQTGTQSLYVYIQTVDKDAGRYIDRFQLTVQTGTQSLYLYTYRLQTRVQVDRNIGRLYFTDRQMERQTNQSIPKTLLIKI